MSCIKPAIRITALASHYHTWLKLTACNLKDKLRTFTD